MQGSHTVAIKASIVMLGMVLSLLFAAPVLASTYHIVEYEYVGPEGRAGPAHPLTGVYVHSLDGHGACAEAADTEGFWIGTAYCTTGETLKPLCGCGSRYGLVRAQFNEFVFMNGHENW